MNIIRGTSKAFDVCVDKNKVPQTLTGVVSIIFKVNKDDTDANAVLQKDADSYDIDCARFVLTPSDTDITAGVYFYEVRWTIGTDIHSLIIDKVTIEKGVWE